jgi:hypothetical protein
MSVNSSVGGLTIEDIGMKTRAFVALLLFAAAVARCFLFLHYDAAVLSSAEVN